MDEKAVTDLSDNSEIASSAIRSRYWMAAAYLLIAPFGTLLRENWPALIGVLLVWLVLGWLHERWRLGPDYKAIRKAEWEFVQRFGRGPYFFGFAWTLVVYLFVEGGFGGRSVISVGTAILVAMAAGLLCQTLWISHKLRTSAHA